MTKFCRVFLFFIPLLVFTPSFAIDIKSYPRAVSKSVTGTYTAKYSDKYLNLSGASFTFTFPTCVGYAGQEWTLTHAGTSLTQVYTLATTSAQTIGGIASGSYALYTNTESLTVYCDGANLQIRTHFAKTAAADAGALTVTGSTSNPTKGTTTYENFWWSRDGEFVNWRYDGNTAAAGSAAGSGDYQIALPTGLGINTSKTQALATVIGGAYPNATLSILGNGYINHGAGAAVATVWPYVMSSTQMKFIVLGYGVWGSGLLPFTSQKVWSVNGRHPVTGWQP